MPKRNEPFLPSYVDGKRVIRDNNPRPLEPFEAYSILRHRQKSILIIVFLVLLVAALIGLLSGGEPKTFASLLQMLQTVPNIDMSWLNFESLTLYFPVWLDWLIPVYSIFENFFRLLGFFCTGTVQGLIFILHILKWCFI